MIVALVSISFMCFYFLLASSYKQVTSTSFLLGEVAEFRSLIAALELTTTLHAQLVIL